MRRTRTRAIAYFFYCIVLILYNPPVRHSLKFKSTFYLFIFIIISEPKSSLETCQQFCEGAPQM